MTGQNGRRTSFLVRVWLDEAPGDGRRVPWSGRIVHVPTDDERHVSELTHLAEFVAEHLQRIGARLSAYWRLRLWVRRLSRRPRDS